MSSVLVAHTGGSFGHDGGVTPLFVNKRAAAANHSDLDDGTQGYKPRYRGPKPLENWQVVPAEPLIGEPGHPDILSSAACLFLECCRVVLYAAAGGRALVKSPIYREISVLIGACLQELVQDRPSGTGDSRSRGVASVATSTPAASTPSRSNKPSAKKRRWASDGDEDGSGRREGGGGGGGGGGAVGGKRRTANAKYACPFYIFNKHMHASCRDAVLRNLSDVSWHIERAHQEPEVFCPKCWKDFESGDRLEEHRDSQTPCRERRFPHYWARKQDLEAVRRRRQPNHQPKAEWLDIYIAIFADAPCRPPIFDNAIAQDFVDTLENYRQSQSSQDLADFLGNELLESFWQIFNDSIVNFLGGEQLAADQGQPSNGRHHSDLPLGSSSSIQQTPMPQTAPDAFSDSTAGLLSAGLIGQGLSPGMPTHGSSGAFGSMMDPSFFSGQHFGQYSGFGFPDPQATQLQSTAHVPGSTYFQTHHFAGHVPPSGLMSQTAPQMFSQNLPNPQSTMGSQPIAAPLGQGFGMPNVTQTPPPQQALPSQILGTARGSQAATPGMLTGTNPGQRSSYMGYHAAPASPLNSRKRRR